MSPETESLHNTIQESMEECSSFIIEICDRECMLSLLTLSEKLTWSRHQHIYIKPLKNRLIHLSTAYLNMIMIINFSYY